MTQKEYAKAKIRAAAKRCEVAEQSWRAAAHAINGSISTNGYGIHHDRFQLRHKLLEAQKHIEQSLATLTGIEWPIDSDYDTAEM